MLCGASIHALTRSIAPIQERLEFTNTSGSTLREQTFNSTNGILSLAITLRIPGTRSNMLKVPLTYKFRELRRGKARPIIGDQRVWHSKSAKGGH